MKEKHIHGGDVYRRPGILDFSANCNPFGTPSGVIKAGAEAMGKICCYPDVEYQRLRQALVEEEEVPGNWIICGNGAADLIFSLVLARKPKKALLAAPSFAEYSQALKALGCEIQYHYLKEEEGFRPGEDFIEAVTEETQLVFFCNPNNPTGTASSKEYVYRLAQQCRRKQVFLAVDECFNDFLEKPEDYSMKSYLDQFPGMLLLKAFTKKYAMAGIRLGYGLCSNQEILEEMRAVMQPWSVSLVAQEAGIAALREKEYVRTTLAKIRGERNFLMENMRKLGYFLFDSQANYIFFKGPSGLEKFCLDRNISIRDCSNYEGLGRGYYRVAVRTREENQKLLQVLQEGAEKNREER